MKYGSKYVSLKEDDPYTVSLERALEVIRLKQEADANRIIIDFGVDDIQVLNGRYGPYITDRKKNAKVPKEREPRSLTLEECRALLAQAPERGKGRWARGNRRATAPQKSAPAAHAPASVPARRHRAETAKPARIPPARTSAAHSSAARRSKASTELKRTAAADGGGRRRAAAKKPAKGKRLSHKPTRKSAPGRARGVK